MTPTELGEERRGEKLGRELFLFFFFSLAELLGPSRRSADKNQNKGTPKK